MTSLTLSIRPEVADFDPNELFVADLPFIKEKGKGKKRRRSYWQVKSTGVPELDNIVGRTCGLNLMQYILMKPTLSDHVLPTTLRTIAKNETNRDLINGFIGVITELAIAGAHTKASGVQSEDINRFLLTLENVGPGISGLLGLLNDSEQGEEDLKIGDKFRNEIDNAIKHYDKLLLILSEPSISSEWVGDEVESALDKEQRRGGNPVLFPIKIDDSIFDTDEAWAKKIRLRRHIGEFTNWKDHDQYQKAFDRLLRDLQAKPKQLGDKEE